MIAIARTALSLALLLTPALAQAQTALPADGLVPPRQEFLPPSGKGRIVVLFSGQSGPPTYVAHAQEIAKAGYFTVLFDSNLVWLKNGQDIWRAILAKVKTSPAALPGKVGVVGFSLGGGPTLAYASRASAEVAAVVATYPLTSYINDVPAFASAIGAPTLLMAAVKDVYKDCCLIAKARALAATKSPLLEYVEYADADHGFTLKGPTFRATDAADASRRLLAHLAKNLN